MGRQKYTTCKFKEIISEMYGNEYQLISNYESSKQKAEFKHTICGNNFFMRPNDFIHGYKCPHCYASKPKSTEQFRTEVFNLVDDEYEVLGEYKNNKTKILIKHKKCENTFETTPHTFLRCHSCKYCAGVAKKSTEQFKKEVFNLVGNEYEVLGEYKSTHEKIMMKHVKCGNKYLVSPDKFLCSRRCPICRESKGEKTIENFLQTNNIGFIRQKTFSNCKNIHTLPFDFYITEKNILIEYDGEHHYKPIFGEERFKKTIENDEIKNKFAASNSIELIRIPYWDFNKIDKILKKKLL